MCDSTSSAALIPMDAPRDAGASRVQPRLWEQRDQGEPTPLSLTQCCCGDRSVILSLALLEKLLKAP